MADQFDKMIGKVRGEPGAAYVLEPEVSAIRYRPNAERGSRLTPGTFRVNAYKVYPDYSDTDEIGSSNAYRESYSPRTIKATFIWSDGQTTYEEDTHYMSELDVVIPQPGAWDEYPPAIRDQFPTDFDLDGNGTLVLTMSNGGILSRITLPIVTDGNVSSDEENAADPPYIQIPNEYLNYTSGGWIISTGKAWTTNAYIRLQGSCFVQAHAGDYVEFLEPFSGVVLVQNTLSGTTPFWTSETYKTGKVYIPDTCDGKRLFVSVKTDGSTDISSLVSTVGNYVKFHHKVYNGNLPYCKTYERFTTYANHATIDTSNVATEPAFTYSKRTNLSIISLPTSYTPTGTPTPVIMMCHGLNGYVAESTWNGSSPETSTFLAMVKAYTDAGFAVFDVNQVKNGTDKSYDLGCPELIERYLAAWEYIRTYYNVQPQLLIHGYSFGTYSVMFFLRHYPAMFKAGIISGARASIESVYNAESDTIKEEIGQNFYFSDPTAHVYEPKKTIGVDSYALIETRNNEKYLPFQIPPLFAVTSLSDTSYYQQTYDMIEALRNGGNYIEWRILQNADHTTACAGVGFTEDFVSWFKRFAGSDHRYT